MENESAATTSAGRNPDWRIAVGLSVVPGLGQLYCRQIRKGIGFFVGTVISIGAALVFFVAMAGFGPAIFNALGLLFLLIALASVFVFLGVFILGLWEWGSAFVDAHHTALALCDGRASDARQTVRFRL